MCIGTSSMSSPEIKKSRRHRKVACLRCSSRKVKCSGDRPSCKACTASKHSHECTYPTKSRRILVLNTDIEEMKERIRELEAECSRLKSTTKGDSVECPSVIPLYLEKKSVHDNNSGTLAPTIRSARGAAVSTNTIVPYMLRAPEIAPNVPGNSSCQIFVGALQRHLIRDSMGQNHSSKISKPPISIPEELAKNYVRRLYLDDKALDARSDRLLVLPEKSYALKMVNKVFHFFAREYGLFSLAEFEARIEETYKNVQDQSLTWLAFLFITLAVGEQYTNKTGSKNKVPGMDFFLTTLRFFHEPIEEPTIDSIRTLLLIAFYSQGLNRMNSVFTYTGLALSTAMILGVHRRASNAGLTDLEKEERSKLWWTAFLMDSLWASRLGLPPHFNLDDMDIEFPNENMLKHDEFDPKYLIANTQLALCVGSVMKEVYGISGSDSFIKNTICSLERLEAFFDNLNPELKVVPERITTNRSTENLHLRYNQMIIVTVRPLYLSLIKEGKMCTKVMDEVKLKCIDAALLNVNILSSLYDSGWFSAFGFLEAQCCFSSILILVMETLNGRSFSELPMALSLNKYMCEAGNITALDNHQRLKDLDRILFEAEKERQRKKEAATENKTSIHTMIGNGESEMITVNHDFQQHPLTVKEEYERDERAQESISSGQDSNLPFLLDLDSSGIGLEQFSPNTLYNLSTTFQKWDSAPIYRDRNSL